MIGGGSPIGCLLVAVGDLAKAKTISDLLWSVRAAGLIVRIVRDWDIGRGHCQSRCFSLYSVLFGAALAIGQAARTIVISAAAGPFAIPRGRRPGGG